MSLGGSVEGGNAKAGASPSWGLGLMIVIGVGLAYGLAYSALRLSLSDNLPQDDVTSNVLTQMLALGYVPRQPPLYEWLHWSVQQVTGPTLPSFLLIKYGLLTGTVAFLYLAATRIFRERGFAILAGLSPFLLFQFAWNLHEGVTHSMVLTCLVAASLWALMRITENGRAWDYLLFGLIAGLGLISKWGFAGFLRASLHQRDAPAVAPRANSRPALSLEPLRDRGGRRAGRLLAHCRRARSRRALWQCGRTQGACEPAARDADRTWRSPSMRRSASCFRST